MIETVCNATSNRQLAAVIAGVASLVRPVGFHEGKIKRTGLDEPIATRLVEQATCYAAPSVLLAATCDGGSLGENGCPQIKPHNRTGESAKWGHIKPAIPGSSTCDSHPLASTLESTANGGTASRVQQVPAWEGPRESEQVLKTFKDQNIGHDRVFRGDDGRVRCARCAIKRRNQQDAAADAARARAQASAREANNAPSPGNTSRTVVTNNTQDSTSFSGGENRKNKHGSKNGSKKKNSDNSSKKKKKQSTNKKRRKGQK
ncbi:hypothetical protein H7J87_26610 [Mycolicibacterium wolinskyi]|uniref:hypothetical protein n=1 Tax=Mycolicibacterium TaxID=1866885 RepID=UPI0010554347|nr:MULTISPECIES: hypothetical protein [Mycolicibacterium]MCV7288905.1 hypothetical protein [Mycolicibacterium wolinskyi]MCV7296943.1 hypothetical protein [Mycolicibacterium goodii]